MEIRRSQMVAKFADSIHSPNMTPNQIFSSKYSNVYNVRSFYVLLSLIHAKCSCTHSADTVTLPVPSTRTGRCNTSHHLMADDWRDATAPTCQCCHIDVNSQRFSLTIKVRLEGVACSG